MTITVKNVNSRDIGHGHVHSRWKIKCKFCVRFVGRLHTQLLTVLKSKLIWNNSKAIKSLCFWSLSTTSLKMKSQTSQREALPSSLILIAKNYSPFNKILIPKIQQVKQQVLQSQWLHKPLTNPKWFRKIIKKCQNSKMIDLNYAN